jgi:hypothetical protein
MPIAPGPPGAGAVLDQDIGDQAHHKRLAQFEERAQPAGATKAPITEHHGRLLQGAPRVGQQRQEGGFPQVLRAWDIGLGECCGLYRHGPTAHHHSRHSQAPVMVPFRPVNGDEPRLTMGAELQELGGELLVIKPRVMQEPREAGQRAAEWRAPLHGPMPGHGQGGGSGPFGSRRDHQGQRLLLRAPKGASHGLSHRRSSQGAHREPLRLGWFGETSHAEAIDVPFVYLAKVLSGQGISLD